jgi:hypothetical protein
MIAAVLETNAPLPVRVWAPLRLKSTLAEMVPLLVSVVPLNCSLELLNALNVPVLLTVTSLLATRVRLTSICKVAPEATAIVPSKVISPLESL